MLCRFENGKRMARSRIPVRSRLGFGGDRASAALPPGAWPRLWRRSPGRGSVGMRGQGNDGGLLGLVRPWVSGCRTRWDWDDSLLSQGAGWVWGCGNGIPMALLAVMWSMRMMVVIVEMMWVIVDMSVASMFSSIFGLFRTSVVSVFRFFRSIIVDVLYPEFMWSVV